MKYTRKQTPGITKRRRRRNAPPVAAANGQDTAQQAQPASKYQRGRQSAPKAELLPSPFAAEVVKRRKDQKYDANYHPALLLKLMSEGASYTEVASMMGVWRETLYHWRDRHEEFKEAMELGAQLAESWWEYQGRRNIGNKNFNATLFMMHMQNRFGWSRAIDGVPLKDNPNETIVRHEHTHTHKVKENDAETTATILGILAGVGAFEQRAPASDSPEAE